MLVNRKIKIRLIFAMMFMIPLIIFGQQQNQVKIYYGFVSGDYVFSKDLDGAGSSNPFKANEIGIRYNRKMSNHFRIETGINYFSSKVTVKSAPLPERYIFKDSFQLLTVPVSLIAEFWKYFYVNGGLFFDFQTKETKYLDSQSGIGFVLGLGVKYDYKDFIFYLTPKYRRHRIVGFKTEKYPRFLVDSTIELGVGYDF